MDDKTLSTIRHAVCAIGSVSIPLEDYHADPMRKKFDIEGTGFLIGPRGIQTCAHVIDSLEQKQKKSGPRPFNVGAQFVHPPRLGADAEMTTSFRSFTVIEQSDIADIAILRMQGSEVPCDPVRLVSEDYIPRVGESVGLCGYAHGSTLLTRGGVVYRFGPVVQSGIIAALSPYDHAEPESVILDLLTGPAASGSPVFRWDTGEVIGMLAEGQIKGSAALSIARLIYRNAAGIFMARAARVQLTRVDRDTTGGGNQVAESS